MTSLQQKIRPIMDVVLNLGIIKAFRTKGSFYIYGGLLRFMLENCELPFEEQVTALEQYLTNGGDIDLLVINNLKSFLSAGLIKRHEYSYNTERIKERKRLKEAIQKYNSQNIVNIQEIDHNNSIYLLKHPDGSKFNHLHCKLGIKTFFAHKDKEIKINVDITEIECNIIAMENTLAIVRLLLDFDVNTFMYLVNPLAKSAYGYVLTSNSDDHLLFARKADGNEWNPQYHEDIMSNIRKRQFKVLGGKHLVHYYRYVKMYNRGYSIVDEQYDYLAGLLGQYQDTNHEDSALITDFLSRADLFQSFIELAPSSNAVNPTASVKLTKDFSWSHWIENIIIKSAKADCFDLLRPYLPKLLANCLDHKTANHLEPTEAQDDDSSDGYELDDCDEILGVRLFGALCREHFDIFMEISSLHKLRVTKDCVYSLAYSSDNGPFVPIELEAVDYLVKQLAPIGGNHWLTTAARSTYEIFMRVYNWLEPYSVYMVDWQGVAQVAMSGRDYRIAKWIRDVWKVTLVVPMNIGTINYQMAEFILTEVYSDDTLYKIFTNNMYEPALLLIPAISDKITPIFVEWYLGKHLSALESFSNDTLITSVYMILDVFLQRYRDITIAFVREYEPQDFLIKQKLCYHAQYESKNLPGGSEFEKVKSQWNKL
jgi:hypothetical protein